MNTEDQGRKASTALSMFYCAKSAHGRPAGRGTPEDRSGSATVLHCPPETSEEVPSSQSRIDCLPRSTPLWCCVHLPRLSLEVLGLAGEEAAAAVVDEVQGRVVLHAVSRRAAEQCLAPGLPLAAAYALSPGLRVAPRDPEREQQALRSLGEQGFAFTPRVSLDFPQALLLEVRGSLDLFGGLERLTAKLRTSLSGSGHRFHCAFTPAPFASWLLARSGRERQVFRREELHSVLGDLAIELLDLDARTEERLRKAGISNLRDLWRLPRDGLSRRYGLRLLALLDQAAGSTEPPLRGFRPPARFADRVELPEETERLENFFPAVEALIRRLAQFLSERDAAVSECVLNLIHPKTPATRLHQGLRRPTRDCTHLARLLHERLERMRLPAPVCTVELSSTAIVPAIPLAADLFAERSQDPADWQRLLDQIQARLGPEALRYFSSRPDHRPEHAHQWSALAKDPITAPELRPLWLLPEPRALSCRDLDSVLPGSERIESGWWDGAGIRRDYRRAVDRRGAGLWIYRDLRVPERWYLHGLFG